MLIKSGATESHDVLTHGIDYCAPFYKRYKDQRKDLFQKVYHTHLF